MPVPDAPDVTGQMRHVSLSRCIQTACSMWCHGKPWDFESWKKQNVPSMQQKLEMVQKIEFFHGFFQFVSNMQQKTHWHLQTHPINRSSSAIFGAKATGTCRLRHRWIFQRSAGRWIAPAVKWFRVTLRCYRLGYMSQKQYYTNAANKVENREIASSNKKWKATWNSSTWNSWKRGMRNLERRYAIYSPCSSQWVLVRQRLNQIFTQKTKRQSWNDHPGHMDTYYDSQDCNSRRCSQQNWNSTVPKISL